MTDFASASWDQLKNAFHNFYEKHSRIVQPVVFLILDQQSLSDRTVIIIQKGVDWLKADSTESGNTGEPDVTKYTVWSKYRCPFEEAWTVQCAIEGFCSLEAAEPYFVEDVDREVYVEESEKEEESSSDSDGMTSEDYEYGDFPLTKGPR